MLFQRINRTSPEKVLISVLVEEANGVVEGDSVKWSTTGSAAYPLGVAVVKTAAATDLHVAGVVWNSGKTDTILKDDPCLIQVFGVHSNVKIAGALAAAGLPVIPTATAGQAGAGATPGDDPSARMGISLAAVAAGRAPIFLRLL